MFKLLAHVFSFLLGSVINVLKYVVPLEGVWIVLCKGPRYLSCLANIEEHFSVVMSHLTSRLSDSQPYHFGFF